MGRRERERKGRDRGREWGRKNVCRISRETLSKLVIEEIEERKMADQSAIEV